MGKDLNKYQKLTDIEHVLARPSMYIGSIVPHNGPNWLYDGSLIWKGEITYNPGFIKTFDEILSNSVDEHKRNSKLNEIRVTINLDTNEITIWDNGGIPVQKHPIHKEWIPEMIFSNLKAGSNFDDTEQRTVAGTNGVGSTLTNIFSKKFTISTCDGKNKFYQEFTNNMHDRTKVKITNGSRGYTEISYIADFKRFQMSKIDNYSYLMFFKRCLDVAACNTKLTVKFTKIENEKSTAFTLKFKNFSEYIKLYNNPEFFYEESKDWKIGFAKSDSGFTNVSFVNSVNTKNGGSHVDYITNQLINHLREMIKKKYKVEVKPNDIRNYLTVFIDCTVINSLFSSQTKDELITEQKAFGTVHEITEKIAKSIFKSEIIASVLDWIQQKTDAQERAELRKLNGSLDKTKVLKLIDAQKKGDRGTCILGIYEGLCLEENNEILLFKDEIFSNIKIKDASIGDFVLSHENKIEEIYQISKRIEKCIKINLANNKSITCSENHRFFIFNSETQIFDFVKAKNLNIKIHKFLKNRLIYFDSFYEILDILENIETYDLLLSKDISLIVSKNTKVCIFNKLKNQFQMILPENINSNYHFFVNFRNL